MSGNGWLCHKVRILFWNWPKSSPFFHAECASCGVLAGDSGASVAENRGEFWEISVIVSVFLLRFGGGRSAVDLCSQIGGRGATKKGASDSTRAVGCTEKGDHGAEIRRKTCPPLVGEWVPLSAWAEGWGSFRCAAVANRCRTARRGGVL